MEKRAGKEIYSLFFSFIFPSTTLTSTVRHHLIYLFMFRNWENCTFVNYIFVFNQDHLNVIHKAQIETLEVQVISLRLVCEAAVSSSLALSSRVDYFLLPSSGRICRSVNGSVRS